MSLTLEVSGPEARRLGAGSRKVFAAAGGRIGRLPDNEWVLEDSYVSGHHAVIRYANGGYSIEDTSSNGTFLNSPENRLAKNRPHPLKSGDRLFIDAFEIRVTITADARPAAAEPRAGAGAPGGSALAGLFDSTDAGPAAPLSASETAKSPRIPADPFDADDPFGGTAPSAGVIRPSSAPPRRNEPLIPDDPLDEEADPLALLGLPPKLAPAGPVPRAEQLSRGDPLRENYRPPASVAPPPPPTAPPAQPPGLIPDDYDPLSGEEPVRAAPRPAPLPPTPAPPAKPPSRSGPASQRPAPPARPAPPVESVWATSSSAAKPSPPAPPRSTAPAAPRNPPPAVTPAKASTRPAAPAATNDFAALLAAAGVEGAAVTPELMEDFGRILRVVVAGIMDLLRSRERIKDEFRMRMTTFKAADNNPLKFSVNVEDALHNLLVKRNSAYLGPVTAFEDAFQDARNHQVAMLAGLRVAFEAMLGEFDPERLQEGFDRQVKKGGILAGPARLKYWDLYRERYHDMVKDADTAFRELFGEEFAKAYEEQMQRLKISGRAQDRS
jgi:type VI secretion system FHA domain protein